MGLRQRLLGGGAAGRADAARPETLARRRGRPAPEGLAWLGHRPDGRAGVLYRLLLAFGLRFLFGAAGMRLSVTGGERLPSGGYLLVVGLHRSWVDPLVVIAALPREPRPWFLGSGPSAFDRPWKEALLRRIGGILPVWRGGLDLAVHEAAARAVIEAGCPFVVFIEGGVAGPGDALGHLRNGAGLLALRLGCPVVPLALAGTSELYRGRRIAARFLPAVTAAELLPAPDDDTAAPAPGSRQELERARQVSEACGDRLAAALSELVPGTVDPSGRPRHWRWLGRLF